MNKNNIKFTQDNLLKNDFGCNVVDNDTNLLSIIVPVYNVERYISDCLDSLLNQGFKETEYEIICVDDGSIDSSYELLLKYANSFSNIRVIHIDNKGVSFARNIGLKNAKGKYIFFCDSDDFIQSNSLKKLINLMIEQNASTLSFGFKSVKENAHFYNNELNSDNFEWYTNSKKIFYSGNIWRFIFLKNLLLKNNIEFVEEMKYAEDEMFIYDVCRYIDFERHIYVLNNLYNYRQRSDSAVHINKSKKINYHIQSMMKMAQIYKNHLMYTDLESQMQKQTRIRFQYSVSNLLQDYLYIDGVQTKTIINDLKEKGLYPYGFFWNLLKPNKIKTMFVNYMKFFFTFPLYYIFIRFIFRKIKEK